MWVTVDYIWMRDVYMWRSMKTERKVKDPKMAGKKLVRYTSSSSRASRLMLKEPPWHLPPTRRPWVRTQTGYLSKPERRIRPA